MAKKDKPDESLARKIWLAGLGAYGRAFTDAAENVAKASQETVRRFEDLAKRGADIEEKAGDLISDKVKLFDRPPLEERLSQFRTAFGMGFTGAKDTAEAEDTGEKSGEKSNVDDLKAQIAALEAQVDALNAKLVKKPAAQKTATRKTVAKKPAGAKSSPRKSQKKD